MPAVLERYDNPQPYGSDEATDAILSIDSVVVGAISPVADQLYKSHTKGLVPTIDNITGTSVDEVWSKIEVLVNLGRVRFQKVVTEMRHTKS